MSRSPSSEDSPVVGGPGDTPFFLKGDFILKGDPSLRKGDFILKVDLRREDERAFCVVPLTPGPTSTTSVLIGRGMMRGGGGDRSLGWRCRRSSAFDGSFPFRVPTLSSFSDAREKNDICAAVVCLCCRQTDVKAPRVLLWVVVPCAGWSAHTWDVYFVRGHAWRTANPTQPTAQAQAAGAVREAEQEAARLR